MKILVVEDDRDLAEILRRALSEELHSVEIALDGEDGQHSALTQAFDLILLDILLPRVDGISLLKTLRQKGKLTPVILLTARDGVGDRILGLDSGADDYLVKPFAMGELFARMRALERRQARAPNGVLKVGSLSLDPRTNYVLHDAHRIPLTAKEFALLQYFMHHPGKVLCRTEILENVWDSNYEGLGNVVDVYVNYLRNKLCEAGAPRMLHTVRGRGYLLAEADHEP
jgi:DNA-binding response OmpR family regulator